MSDASDFFGGGGAVGIFPTWPPKRYNKSKNPGRPWGFNDDGDHFFLPNDADYQLQYYDNTGSVVWTITNPTVVDANCDVWMTFYMDYVDNLLYLLCGDTINNDLYLATVNAAGTIVNIGSASVTEVTTDIAWTGVLSGSVSNRHGASIRRASHGSGNLFVTALGWDWEINSSTGALVNEQQRINRPGGAFELQGDDIWFSLGSNFSASGPSNIDSDTQVLQLSRPDEAVATTINDDTWRCPVGVTGLPNRTNTSGFDSFTVLYWGTELYISAAGTPALSGAQIFDPLEFEQATRTFAKNVGWL